MAQLDKKRRKQIRRRGSGRLKNLWIQILTQVAIGVFLWSSLAEFLVPDLGDIVDSGIELYYRPAGTH
jgi:hypothetical protein